LTVEKLLLATTKQERHRRAFVDASRSTVDLIHAFSFDRRRG
jgi:hypothetical protein